MSNTKHTSGPWQIWGMAIAVNNGDDTICEVYSNKADLHLIAAAPEQNAALIKANGLVQKSIITANEKARNEFLREAIYIMEAAIKKATE